MEVALIGLLLTVAVAVNLPLGLWRSGLRRFSPWWFVAVHGSIPLLFAMRLALVRQGWVIAPEVALAVVGQVVGGRLPALMDLGPFSGPSGPDAA
jgi:hypothetical protein